MLRITPNLLRNPADSKETEQTGFVPESDPGARKFIVTKKPYAANCVVCRFPRPVDASAGRKVRAFSKVSESFLRRGTQSKLISEHALAAIDLAFDIRTISKVINNRRLRPMGWLAPARTTSRRIGKIVGIGKVTSTGSPISTIDPGRCLPRSTEVQSRVGDSRPALRLADGKQRQRLLQKVDSLPQCRISIRRLEPSTKESTGKAFKSFEDEAPPANHPAIGRAVWAGWLHHSSLRLLRPQYGSCLRCRVRCLWLRDE